MSKAQLNAISPTRAEDYPEWYQQVVKAADMAETSAVRGCMVIKPWGYAIWENMQRVLDAKFKETGHENAYFPLFIPLSLMEKEAQHVEGFAKECAVVTHHRLEAGPNGTLVPAGKLDEPLVVRPTSEMIIGQVYAKWVQSYRDLPILINQWANVVRWEMRTRMFLRTTEFLWQEGHTVHATADEAVEETLKMLDVYEEFANNYMAMPVIKGEKAPHERFPGADNTYTIEAMMQDRKALQAGTSHFLGQNFSKAMDIRFQNEKGEDVHAWTTSWGVSTRLVGGLIMTHSDDDGLILPPRLAPRHVVIMPILGKTEEDKQKVLAYCKALEKEIAATYYAGEPVRVLIDAKDTGGGKAWGHIKKGVPIRIEVGPRDIASDSLFVGLRTNSPKDKKSFTREEFLKGLSETLTTMQQTLYDRALKHREENTVKIDSLDELKKFFTAKTSDEEKAEAHGGFALVHWVEDENTQKLLKEMKISHRCIPLDGPNEEGKCIFTGKPSKKRSILAKSY
ncbi:MAG: proline--tRNA ligase [Proteobacteria bacterium]|nr:MAG: proline--tRNA ligase [Pseudomonadota bacterium]